MNVTPIGGKSPASTLIGIAVDAAGNVITKKIWSNTSQVIFTGIFEDTTTHYIDGETDVSDCGAFSLRIANTTDAAATITFASDVTANNVALKGTDGVDYSIPVAANKRFMMATPDDYPFLQWIRNVRLIIKFETIPTAGEGNELKIYLVKKM